MIRLVFRPPYDWATISAFLASRAIPGVEAVDTGGRYHRTVTVDGNPGTLCVAMEPGGEALLLSIAGLDPACHPAIVARVARIFDVAADPVAIRAGLGGDPIMAPLLARRPGLRVPGAWDGFELAIRAILGQQITVVAACRLAGRLVARFGTPLDMGASQGLSHLFPTPAIIAAADLGVLGMPGSRARALSALAAAARDDPELFALGRPLDVTIARLKAIRGIGDWTAHYIAMRALRHADAFPAADIGLMRALVDSQGRRPNARELLARAEAWRPWRAYAALHLWNAEPPATVVA